MSHPAQMVFVEKVRATFPECFVRSTVLEVGSLNLNGSIRQFFQQCIYVGVDIGPGKDVDLVARGENLAYEDESFTAVTITATLQKTMYAPVLI